MENRPIRSSYRRLACYLAALLIGSALCACSSTPVDNSPGTPRSPASYRELNLKADQLYSQAHKLLINSDYERASKAFDKVITRFPFTPYATQSQLEQIYAQYRSYQTDAASSDADLFLREHPRHPHADYVLYLKGLIDQSRDKSLLYDLPIDTTQFDPSNKQRAFQDFALLAQRYPHSKYYSDARQRMIYLRDQIASHEFDVAQFYTHRGAWLSAAKRAQGVVADYPGAPATADALLLLKRCYAKLGLTALENQVETLITANAGSIQAAKSPAVMKAVANAAPPAMTDVPAAATLPSAANKPATDTAVKTSQITPDKAASQTTADTAATTEDKYSEDTHLTMSSKLDAAGGDTTSDSN